MAKTPRGTSFPLLRPEIVGFRFSPDGKFLFAQDESGIHVAQREPLELLFRIPARGAGPMVIDADSRTVAFRASGLRVEVWDLISRQRKSVRDIVHRGCFDGKPSPGGEYFACLGGLQFTVIDVASGDEIATRRFQAPSVADNPLAFFMGVLARMRGQESVSYAFSPDGGSILVSPVGGMAEGNPWAFNLKTRSEIQLHKHIKTAIAGSFAFVNATRVAVMNPGVPKESGLFEWPGGKEVERFAIPNAYLSPVAKGPYVILRPFRTWEAALMHLERKEMINGSQIPAIDRYNDFLLSELRNGELGLYNGKSQVGALQLPSGDLGLIRGGAHSPDLEWLVLSGMRRSGFWGIKDGVGGLFAPFDGSHIGADHRVFLEFENSELKGGAGVERTRQLVSIDLNAKKSEIISRLPPKGEDKTSMHGRYRLASVATGEERFKGKVKLAVTDISQNKELWTQLFEGSPIYRASETSVILQWPVTEKAAERYIQTVPSLKRQLSEVADKDGVQLMRVFSIATGEPAGHTLVDTGKGSFFILRAAAVGKTLLLTDNRNRTIAYSLETGERIGQQFGSLRGVDAAKGRVCLENTDGDVRILNAATMKEIANFEYASPVVYAGFSGDGGRLLVVTAKQDVFIQPIP